MLENQYLVLTTAKPRHILAVSASMLAYLQFIVVLIPSKGGRNEEEAGRLAINYLVQMFFNGSAEQAVAALPDLKRTNLTESDFDHLSGLIERTRQEGR